jgi:hypothetical protein
MGRKNAKLKNAMMMGRSENLMLQALRCKEREGGDCILRSRLLARWPVGLERMQLGKRGVGQDLGGPHLAKLRRDLGFEPCDHGNDVVTVGRLVSYLVIDELSGAHRIV